MTKTEIKEAALKAQAEEKKAFDSFFFCKSGSCRAAMLRKAEKFGKESDRLWALYFSSENK